MEKLNIDTNVKIGKNNEGENKIFTQNCIGRYNVINKIVVNKSGFIEEISQGITNTNKPWILSKN